MIASLYFYWGYNAIEVANFFKISESRVSQILQRIQSGVSTRIAKEARGPRKGTGKMDAMGEIEAEEISLGTAESLAFKEPGTMEKNNAEMFCQRFASEIL